MTQSVGNYYWRVTQFLLPIFALIPSASGLYERCDHLDADRRQPLLAFPRRGTRVRRRPPGARQWRKPGPPSRPILPTEPGTFRFPDGAEIDTLMPKFRRPNRYGLDRSVQRKVSFSGMPFIPTQDQAMTEGMGYVCDRSQEHLGTTDLTIIHMRRLMHKLVTDLEQGVEPHAASRPELYRVGRWTSSPTTTSCRMFWRNTAERRCCRFRLTFM